MAMCTFLVLVRTTLSVWLDVTQGLFWMVRQLQNARMVNSGNHRLVNAKVILRRDKKRAHICMCALIKHAGSTISDE